MKKTDIRLRLTVYGFLFTLLPVLSQLSTMCCAQEDPAQKAREHFSAGRLLMQEGNFAAADEEFKKAQALLKGYPAQMQDAAEPAQETPIPHRPAASVKIAGAASPAIPEAQGADSHYNLAMRHLKNQQYKDAARTLLKVIRLNPRDKDAYYNLGVLYESYLGDKRQALNYYAQYLKHAPRAEDAPDVRTWIRQIKKELKQND